MSTLITKPHLHIIIPISRPSDQVYLEARLCSFKKKRERERGSERERERESKRGKNSAHFESCLKFSARVQITLKHVHGIEWLICIKKKKGGGMEGWKEVREGRLRELSGARKAKILWISCHYTCRGADPFTFCLWTLKVQYAAKSQIHIFFPFYLSCCSSTLVVLVSLADFWCYPL